MELKTYLDIIDKKTLHVVGICAVAVWLCREFDFSYDMDWIFLGAAVVFPLVFTIKQSFQRRERALRMLSQFKASMHAFYRTVMGSTRIDDTFRLHVTEVFGRLSSIFLTRLKGDADASMEESREAMRAVHRIISAEDSPLGNRTALKLVRVVQDLEEALEELNAIKSHRTPVSMRAYLLLSIYIVPFILTPTLSHYLTGKPIELVFALSSLNGFILISLYNVQAHLEDPFDQRGLDDIHLNEFEFEPDFSVSTNVSATDAGGAPA